MLNLLALALLKGMGANKEGEMRGRPGPFHYMHKPHRKPGSPSCESLTLGYPGTYNAIVSGSRAVSIRRHVPDPACEHPSPHRCMPQACSPPGTTHVSAPPPALPCVPQHFPRPRPLRAQHPRRDDDDPPHRYLNPGQPTSSRCSAFTPPFVPHLLALPRQVVARLPPARLPLWTPPPTDWKTPAPLPPSTRPPTCLTSRARLLAVRYLSALSAAMQPAPAAVMACRHSVSCRSPAANTPGTEVDTPCDTLT